MIKRIIKNPNIFTWVLGYLLPVILLFGVICINYHSFLFPGLLIINILCGIILVLLFSLINNKIMRFVFDALGLFIFNVIVFIQLSHIYLFENVFSTSSVYILLETNYPEAQSFINAYFDLYLFWIGLIIICTCSLSILLIFINIKTIEEVHELGQGFRKKKLIKISVLLVLILLFYSYLMSNETRLYYFTPYTMINGFQNYKADQLKTEKLGHQRFGGEFSNVKHNSDAHGQIVVLVLGESISRHHMGLYGYYRNTNPLLGEIRDEMVLFTDVISPNSTSIPSLSKILTMEDYGNPNGKFNGSLIQLFNKAGFTTYWISSQLKTGIYDSFVTSISNSSHQQIFISNYNYLPLDGELVNSFEKVLSDHIEGNKLIILHLMGAHAMYDKRYPENFQEYDNDPITPFKHKNAYNKINQYDNAILYNDYVLNEMIMLLKKKTNNSTLVYLSDHGEEVFKNVDNMGHWEENGSKDMYDIPFLLWFSNRKEDTHKHLVFDETRKFNAENLLYTLADLANIEFQQFDPTKSLVNKNFQFKPRIVSSNVDYDKFFK